MSDDLLNIWHTLSESWEPSEHCKDPLALLFDKLTGSGGTDICPELKKRLEELWVFLNSVKLTKEEKKTLQTLRKKIEQICEGRQTAESTAFDQGGDQQPSKLRAKRDKKGKDDGTDSAGVKPADGSAVDTAPADVIKDDKQEVEVPIVPKKVGGQLEAQPLQTFEDVDAEAGGAPLPSKTIEKLTEPDDGELSKPSEDIKMEGDKSKPQTIVEEEVRIVPQKADTVPLDATASERAGEDMPKPSSNIEKGVGEEIKPKEESDKKVDIIPVPPSITEDASTVPLDTTASVKDVPKPSENKAEESRPIIAKDDDQKMKTKTEAKEVKFLGDKTVKAKIIEPQAEDKEIEKPAATEITPPLVTMEKGIMTDKAKESKPCLCRPSKEKAKEKVKDTIKKEADKVLSRIEPLGKDKSKTLEAVDIGEEVQSKEDKEEMEKDKKIRKIPHTRLLDETVPASREKEVEKKETQPVQIREKKEPVEKIEIEVLKPVKYDDKPKSELAKKQGIDTTKQESKIDDMAASLRGDGKEKTQPVEEGEMGRESGAATERFDAIITQAQRRSSAHAAAAGGIVVVPSASRPSRESVIPAGYLPGKGLPPVIPPPISELPEWAKACSLCCGKHLQDGGKGLEQEPPKPVTSEKSEGVDLPECKVCCSVGTQVTPKSKKVAKSPEMVEKLENVERVEKPVSVKKAESPKMTERLESVERVEKPVSVRKVESSKMVERMEKAVGVAKVESPKMVERLESVERMEKALSAARVESPKMVERLESVEMMEKAVSAGRVESPEMVERLENVERMEKAVSVARVESPKMVERLESVERMEKAVSAARVESPEMVERLENVERTEKAVTVGMVESPKMVERLESVEMMEKAVSAGRVESPEMVERLENVERMEKAVTVGRVESPKMVERLESVERMEKAVSAGRVERPEMVERLESVERMEKAVSVGRVESPEMVERLESVERMEKAVSVGRVESPEMVERIESVERMEKAVSVGRVESPEMVERLETVEKMKKAVSVGRVEGVEMVDRAQVCKASCAEDVMITKKVEHSTAEFGEKDTSEVTEDPYQISESEPNTLDKSVQDTIEVTEQPQKTDWADLTEACCDLCACQTEPEDEIIMIREDIEQIDKAPQMKTESVAVHEIPSTVEVSVAEESVSGKIEDVISVVEEGVAEKTLSPIITADTLPIKKLDDSEVPRAITLEDSELTSVSSKDVQIIKPVSDLAAQTVEEEFIPRAASLTGKKLVETSKICPDLLDKQVCKSVCTEASKTVQQNAPGWYPPPQIICPRPVCVIPRSTPAEAQTSPTLEPKYVMAVPQSCNKISGVEVITKDKVCQAICKDDATKNKLIETDMPTSYIAPKIIGNAPLHATPPRAQYITGTQTSHIVESKHATFAPICDDQIPHSTRKDKEKVIEKINQCCQTEVCSADRKKSTKEIPTETTPPNVSEKGTWTCKCTCTVITRDHQSETIILTDSGEASTKIIEKFNIGSQYIGGKKTSTSTDAQRITQGVCSTQTCTGVCADQRRVSANGKYICTAVCSNVGRKLPDTPCTAPCSKYGTFEDTVNDTSDLDKGEICTGPCNYGRGEKYSKKMDPVAPGVEELSSLITHKDIQNLALKNALTKLYDQGSVVPEIWPASILHWPPGTRYLKCAHSMHCIPAKLGRRPICRYQVRKAKEAYCAEQRKITAAALEKLDNIKNIVEERDDLRKKLETSQKELKTLRRSIALGETIQGAEQYAQNTNIYVPFNGSKPTERNSCEEEIVTLEKEIDAMRSGKLTPDMEAQVIRKEVEVLKKYCTKLSKIQAENQQLRHELKLFDNTMDELGLVGTKELQLDILKEKLAILQETEKERNILKSRVAKLERELYAYNDLPEDIEVFKQRSLLLDEVLRDRDRLSRRVEQLRGVDEEIMVLRKKASKVDELEEKLKLIVKEKNAAEDELEIMRCRSTTAEIESINQKAECDTLRSRLVCMEQEVESLKCVCKEKESLKCEKDHLKQSVDELLRMQGDYDHMCVQMKCLDVLKSERDLYKSKYESILGLECECDILRTQVEKAKAIEKERNALENHVEELECCIVEQENEIRRLVCHIDCLTKGRDKQQGRLKEILGSMRAELERKETVIRSSEEKLACVQDTLRRSIEGLSVETSQLRNRNDKLEQDIFNLKQNNEELLRNLKEKESIINLMSKSVPPEINQTQRMSDELTDSIHAINKEVTKMVEHNEILEAEICKYKEVVDLMQHELKKKDNEINILQEVLQDRESVQDESCLAKASEKVNCPNLDEMVSNLVNENNKLQKLICMSQSKLKEKDNEISVLQDMFRRCKPEGTDDLVPLTNMKLEFPNTENQRLQRSVNKFGSIGGDEHLRQMLSQSKCAIQRIALELNKQYEEWDSIKEKLNKQNIMKGETFNVETSATVYAASIEVGTYNPSTWDCRRKEEGVEDWTQWDCKKAVATVGLDPNQWDCMQPVKDDDVVKQTIAPLEVELSQANDTILELQERLSITDRLSAENAALRRHSTEVQEVAQNQIEELVNHLKKCRESLSKLEDENNILKQKVSDMEADNIKYNDTVAELELLKQEKETIEKMLTSNVVTTSRRSSKLETDLVTLTNDNKRRQEEIEKLKQENTDLANANKRLLNELESSKGDSSIIDAYKKENEQLKQLVESQKREINSLLDELNQSVPPMPVQTICKGRGTDTKDKEALQAIIDDLQNQVKKITVVCKKAVPVDCGNLQSIIDELKKRLEEEQRRADVAEESLKKLKLSDPSLMLNDEIERLKKKLQELEYENNQLKAAQGVKAEVPEATQISIRSLKAAEGDSALMNENVQLRSRLGELDKDKLELQNELNNKTAELNKCYDIISDLQGKNGTLQQEMAKMESENSKLRKDLEAALKETQKWLEKIAWLENEIEKYKQDIEKLQAEIAKLKDELNKMLMTARRESYGVSDLQNELLALKQKLAQVESENDRLKKDLDGAKGDASGVNQLRNENDKLKQANADLERELAHLRQELEALKKELVAATKDDLSGLKDRLAMLEAENAKLKKDAGDLKQLLSQKENEIANMLSKKGIDPSEFNKLQDLLAKLEEENSKLKKDLNTALDDLKQATNTIAHLQENDSQLRHKLAASEAENSKLKSNLDQALDESKRGISMRDDEAKLKQRVAQLETENAKLKKDLDDATANLKSIKDENNTLQKKVVDAENLIAKLRAELAKAKEEEAKKNTLIQGYEAEIDNLRKKLQGAMDNVCQLNELYSGMQQKVAELENENSKLKTDAGKGKGDDDKLRQTIANLESEIEKLKKELSKAISDHQHCGKTNSQLQDEIAKLKQKLAELETENVNLKKNYDQAMGDFGKKESELDKLRQQIAQLNKELAALNNDLKAANNTLAEMKHNEANLKQTLAQLQDENSKLKNSLDGQGTRMSKEDESQLRNKLSQAEKENMKLNDELSKAVEEAGKLRQKIATLEAENAKLKKDLERALADAQANSAGVAPLRDENSKLKDKIAQLEAEIAKLKKDLNVALEDAKRGAEMQAADAKLKQRTNQLEKENEKLKEDLAAALKLAEDVSKLRADNDKLKQTIKQLEDQIDKMKSELEAEKKKVADLETKMKQLQTDLAKKNKEYDDALNKLTEKDAALAKQKRDYEDALAKLKEKDDALLKLKKDHESALDKLRKEHENAVEKLKKERDDAVSKLKEKDDALAKQLKEHADALAKLRKEQEAALNKLKSDHENAVSKLKKDNEDALMKLRKEHEDAIIKLKKEMDNVDTLAKQKKELDAAIEKLKNEKEEALNKLKKERDEAVTRLKAQEEAIAKLKKENEEALNKLKAQEEAMAKIKKERDDALTKLKAKEDEIAKLKKENEEALNKLRKERDDALTKLKATEDAIAKLKKENEEAINRLKKERDDALAKLKAQEDATAKLKKDNEDALNKLQKERDDALSKLKAQEDVVANLKKNNDEALNKLQKERDDALAKLKAKEDDIAKLKKENEEAINRLKKERDDALAKLKAQEDAIAKLKKDNAEALNKIQKERDAALAKLKAQEDEIAKLKKENEEALNKLKKDRDDTLAKLKQLEDALAKSKKEFGDATSKLQKDLDNALKKSADLEAKLKQLNGELEKKQQSAKDDEDTIKKLKDELQMKQRSIKDLEDKIKQLQAELTRQKKECDDSLAKLRDQFEKNMKDALKAGRDSIDKLQKPQKDFMEQMGDSKDLDEKLKKLQAELAKQKKECEDTIAKLKQQFEKDMKDALKREMEKQKQQQEKADALMKQLGQTQTEPEGLEDKLQYLRDELAKQKQLCEEIIANLKEQFDRDMKNLYKKNEESIEKLQKAHEDFIKDLREKYDKEIKALQDALKRAGGDKDKMKTLLDDQRKKSIEIKDKVEKVESVIQKERRKSKELRSMVDKLEKENSDIKPAKKTVSKLTMATFEGAPYFPEVIAIPTPISEHGLNILRKEREAIIREREELKPDNIPDLLRKQKETHQKVLSMQYAVKLEKQRLGEIRKSMFLPDQSQCQCAALQEKEWPQTGYGRPQISRGTGWPKEKDIPAERERPRQRRRSSLKTRSQSREGSSSPVKGTSSKSSKTKLPFYTDLTVGSTKLPKCDKKR